MMMESRESKWLNHLKEEGYRLTGARNIIIEILANTNKALDPAEIYKIAHKRYPSIGLVSVYRTLSILEELSLIQRIHQPEKCQAYLPAFTSHEHLILCNICGRVEFFTGDDIGELVHRVESEYDFHVQGHWLQLFGICKQCQKIISSNNERG
jgi:Fur family ferric uptake transcriptional regulator